MLLIKTRTCPNCKVAERLLNEAGISFEEIYVEDHMEYVKGLGISQAPTLINDDETMYSGLGQINKFLKETKE